MPRLPGPPPRGDEPPIWSVAELHRRLVAAIEVRHRRVWVEGEVVHLTVHASSGHAYFTLKDADAEVRCVMWRDQRRLGRGLEAGARLVVIGEPTIYPRSGQLQLAVLETRPRGRGELALRLRRLAEQLRSEGLTAPDRKRPLPRCPRAVGIVTSGDGAALRDVVRTALRRDPQARLVLARSPVQGEGAAERLTAALSAIGRVPGVDVVLLVRGGGSAEDLAAFHDEALARAIAASPVPVVTGIGHETDRTIADLVSDLSASTPTAAAEQAVPLRAELVAELNRATRRLGQGLARAIERRRVALLGLERRLRHPASRLRERAQALDELLDRAERALARRLAADRRRLDRAERRLLARDPRAEVARARRQLERLEARLHPALARAIADRRQALAARVASLEALSPLAVLGRGYALVEGPRGIVRGPGDVSPGDRIDVRLAAGRITARVEPGDA